MRDTQGMQRLQLRGPNSRGLCVDIDGVALGPALTLVDRTERGYATLDRLLMAPLQKFLFGELSDTEWLFRQCCRMSEALSRGEIAIAQIYGLHVPIDELDGGQLEKLDQAARFIRAGFDPNEPRVPRGSSQGGEWTADGGANNTEEPSSGRSAPTSTNGNSGETPRLRLPSPTDANENPLLLDVVYQGIYHDQVIAELAAHWISQGATVLTSVSLTTLSGITARADLLALDPSGDGLTVFEVKTGFDPQYTGPQMIVYPMAQVGYHVYSSDAKIRLLGFTPRERLPPMRFYTIYKQNPDAPYRWLEHSSPLIP